MPSLLVLEFGSKTIPLPTSLEDLAAVDPYILVHKPALWQDQDARLDGISVFMKHQPRWELFPDGGEYSWRGDLTKDGLERLWRSCCCGLLGGAEIEQWVGFRILNKTKGASSMFKLELWVSSHEAARQRSAIEKKFGAVLPAAMTQFSFVANNDKINRTAPDKQQARSKSVCSKPPV